MHDLLNQITRLRSTLGKMEIALGSIDISILWTDYKGTILWCNSAFDKLVKKEHLYLLGANIFHLLPITQNGIKITHETHPITQAVHVDKEIKAIYELDAENDKQYLRITCQKLSLNNEQVSIVTVIEDITKDKKAEQIQQEYTDKIYDLYNHAPCGYHSLDKDGYFIEINNTELDWLGYSRDEVINKIKFVDLLINDSKEIFDKAFSNLLQGKENRNIEYKLLNKNGQALFGLLSEVPVFDLDGNVIKTRSSTFDITNYKTTEKYLTTQFESIKIFVDNDSLDHAMSSFLKTICTNLQFDLGITWLLDKKKESLIYKNFWCKDEIRSSLNEFVEFSKNFTFRKGVGLPGRVWELQEPAWISNLHIDNNFPRFEYAKKCNLQGAFAVPILYKEHFLGVIEFFHFNIIYKDADVLKMMSSISMQIGAFIEKLQTNEKIIEYTKLLEASQKELEDFTFICAHDLQEPLRKAIYFTEILSDHKLTSPTLDNKHNLDKLTACLKKTQLLVHDFMRYIELTTKKVTFKEIDLNIVMHNITEKLAGKIKKTKANIDISTLPQIYADSEMIHILFENLIDNAIIHQDATTIPEIMIKNCSDGNNIKIEVQDNGVGFNESHIKKIFLPFQKLHTKSSGSGIGLALCKKIMIMHRGEIEIKSTIGKGSSFTLIFPNK